MIWPEGLRCCFTFLHETFSFADSNIFAKCCHQVSEMVHALRTHFNPNNAQSWRVPASTIFALRQVIIGLARLPLVNSFVRVPPVVWKLGWQPVTEGPFKTELPPLPVEILKEKDVLMEFIFRANLIGKLMACTHTSRLEYACP